MGSANGIALATRPAVTIAARFSDVTGGTGGCGAAGNIRVRAVDASGNPISGAIVMVGSAPATSSLVTTYRSGASGSNNATTDADGYAVFCDFGTTLNGAVTVTAGAANREYVTFTGSNAADFVLPLRPLRSTVQTGTYAGQLTNITASGNIEVGLMLADTALNNLATFSFAGLLSRNECPNLGAVVGAVSIPGNVSIPGQTVAFIVNIAEHRHTSAQTKYGDRFLYGIGGNLPLNAVTGGGGLTSALGTLTLTDFGGANLTKVDNVGALANMDDLAITAAFCNDKARAGIPAGTANGTSAIFNRAGADLFAGNPTVSFNNYLPIRSVPPSQAASAASSTQPPPLRTTASRSPSRPPSWASFRASPTQPSGSPTS